MKRLMCWLIGHEYDICDDWAFECFRCHMYFPHTKPPRSDHGFWLTVYGIKRRLCNFFRLERPSDELPF